MTTSPLAHLPISAARPPRSAENTSLTFPGTGIGQPRFQVLTLGQEYTNIPVTLTTNAPAHFQLASDARPQFAPSLTLTPPPEGAHVHVRYAATEPGRHVGQLLIQTPYDTQALTLYAHSGGFVTRFRPGLANRLPVSGGRFVAPSRRWLGILILAVVGGLASLGYTNRCRLAPRFCTETTTVVTSPEPSPSQKLPRVVTGPMSLAAGEPVVSTKKKGSISSSRRRAERRPVRATEPEVPGVQASFSDVEKEEAVQATVRPRSRRRSAAVEAASDVSDLERVLNRKSNN